MKHDTIRRETLACVKRIVLKLGSSVVTTADGLDYRVIGGIVDDVSRLRERGQGIHHRIVGSDCGRCADTWA